MASGSPKPVTSATARSFADAAVRSSGSVGMMRMVRAAIDRYFVPKAIGLGTRLLGSLEMRSATRWQASGATSLRASHPVALSAGRRSVAMLTKAMHPPVPERRHPETSESVSPELLIARHVESARQQLAEGRERLKLARRRVVQLEDALTSWERLAGELRASKSRPAA